MKAANTIHINAPPENIFVVAADLPRWPDFLRHYRYNRYLSQMPWGGVIKMSALRTFIPITWISIFRVETTQMQLHFEHIKSAFNATKGMKVVWNFYETAEGTQVEIVHDLDLKWPLIGPFVAEHIIVGFFIHHIANQTLAGLKRKMESIS